MLPRVESVLGMALLLVGLTSGATTAQEISLAQTLVELSGSVYSGGSFGGQVVVSVEPRRLASPILIPNFLSSSNTISDSFNVLLQIPPVGGAVVVGPQAQEVGQVLHGILSDIQTADVDSSPNKSGDIDSAKRLLFDPPDSDQPSQAYKQYNSFKTDYAKALADLQTQQNPAERANLIARASQIESNWSIFGMRDEIEAALRVLSSGSTAALRSSMDQFAEAVDSYKPDPLTAITQALYTSDWTRVSAGSEKIGSLSLYLSRGDTREDLPKVRRISFDVTLVPLPLTILEQPFLYNHEWRLRSGNILSTGIAKSFDPHELVPSISTHAILLKNLEIVFEGDLSSNAMKMLITQDTITIADIPIGSKKDSRPVIQKRLLEIPAPIIVGVLVGRLAKIPDPNTSLKWEN